MSKLNLLKIDGHMAAVAFDPDLELFRGEFIGLNGNVDFYAATVASLKREGRRSLKEYLAVCAENGVAPARLFSGTFNVRIDSGLHEAAVRLAAARGVSLNALVQAALRREAELACN